MLPQTSLRLRVSRFCARPVETQGFGEIPIHFAPALEALREGHREGGRLGVRGSPQPLQGAGAVPRPPHALIVDPGDGRRGRGVPVREGALEPVQGLLPIRCPAPSLGVVEPEVIRTFRVFLLGGELQPAQRFGGVGGGP